MGSFLAAIISLESGHLHAQFAEGSRCAKQTVCVHKHGPERMVSRAHAEESTTGKVLMMVGDGVDGAGFVGGGV